MSRVRNAFLGVFIAEIAACAFVVFTCLDVYRNGTGISALATAQFSHVVLGELPWPAQPLLMALGAVGGLVASRRGVWRIPLALIVALGSAVILFKVVLQDRTGEELTDGLRDHGHVVLWPALIAALLWLIIVRPDSHGCQLPAWKRHVFALGLATLVWIGGGFAWWLPVLVLMAPVALGFTWRWRWPVLLLLPLAVPATAFVSGVLNYATGTALFVGYGVSDDRGTLDLQTRAPTYNRGCVVTGTEDVVDVPNNSAIRLMGALFGPMPFSYREMLPTDEEAFRLLDEATSAVQYDFDRRTIRFGTEEFTPWGVDLWLVREAFSSHDVENSLVGTKPVTGLLVFGERRGATRRKAFLLDVKTNALIATYTQP